MVFNSTHSLRIIKYFTSSFTFFPAYLFLPCVVLIMGYLEFAVEEHFGFQMSLTP